MWMEHTASTFRFLWNVDNNTGDYMLSLHTTPQPKFSRARRSQNHSLNWIQSLVPVIIYSINNNDVHQCVCAYICMNRHSSSSAMTRKPCGSVTLVYYHHHHHFSGARLSPLGTAATTDLLYQPQMINVDDCGAIGGMKTGKYLEKACPSATLSTTNPTRPNPGRRSGKPATSRLSYGTAWHSYNCDRNKLQRTSTNWIISKI
jgi:hypothetical protein